MSNAKVVEKLTKERFIEGMYDSNRCGFCNDFGKKVKPYICTNCWEMIDKFVQAEREILDDCIERMDRARNILTKGEPTWDNNWGLLDTKLEKEKLKSIRED